MKPGWFEETRDGDRLVLAAVGAWTIDAAGPLDAALRRLSADGLSAARIDLGGIEALDTAGAWLLVRTGRVLAEAGVEVTIGGAAPHHAQIFDRVVEVGPPPPLPPARRATAVDAVARLGKQVVDALRQGRDLLGFFGAVVVTALRVLVHPGRIRFVSFVHHLEQAGLNALPIVGLVAFLIGVVVAYQGVDQFRRFGVQIFTVNLLGISVLRELGILITAILVAGRSGSAYTAQIGTMQVNEEVDAMRTLGLDPIELLVLPRILALIVALPLLTFFADIMAVFGGGVMSMMLIDLTVPRFLRQLQEAVGLWTFWVGIIKAPVFAFLIGMVGCFEGLRVRGSAESLGQLTTRSVVESIFLVIVFDALFSILFSRLGI